MHALVQAVMKQLLDVNKSFNQIIHNTSRLACVTTKINKLKDWAYEDEWRLIYNVGSWYFSYEKVPKEFWTQGKKIKFMQPSRVLLGAKINEAYEKLIRNACEHYNIEVAKMQCTEYGLRES